MFRNILVVSSLLTLAVGCDPTVVAEQTQSTCTYGKQSFEPGSTFTAADGCNTCSCAEDGAVSCTEAACPEPTTCDYAGSLYQVGEMFPATDGCNECACLDDGNVGCTDATCTETVVCNYDGQMYVPGDTFPATDGCNACVCANDGAVICTEEACTTTCNPEDEWWRQYMSDDPDECALLDYECPGSSYDFKSECGCGCEQPDSCRKSFDCSAPDSCDIDTLAHKCPFSEIVQ